MVAKREGETWFAGCSCFVLHMTCLLPNCCAWFCLQHPGNIKRKMPPCVMELCCLQGPHLFASVKRTWALPVCEVCVVGCRHSCQCTTVVIYLFCLSLVNHLVRFDFGEWAALYRRLDTKACSDFTIADRLRCSLSLAASLVTLWTQPFLSLFFLQWCGQWTFSQGQKSVCCPRHILPHLELSFV